MALVGSKSVNRRLRVCDDNARMSVLKPTPLFRSTAAASGTRRRWGLGLATTVVWLAVGLSAGGWALQWLGRSELVDLPAQATYAAAVAPQAVLTAVRGTAAAPAPETESVGAWQLLGVVSTPDGRGAALLSRNGERARPVLVGQALPDGDLVLLGISGREVRLGPQAQGPVTQTLRLPTPVPVPNSAPAPVGAASAAPGQ